MSARAGAFAAGLMAAGLSGALMVAGAPAALGAALPGNIRTAAGGPGRGPGRSVSQVPVAVAAGQGGAVYISDQEGFVRELTVTSSVEKVTAGVAGGSVGNGVPATEANLALPWGVAVDGAGNVVIVDTGSSRVRVVAASSATFYGQAMTAGRIYTVAGNGIDGYSGDGGPATAAELSRPEGVAVDGAGNLVLADEDNERVRVVAASSGTFYGQVMTAGDIYTVAGNGTYGYSGDGGPATAAELGNPWGVAVDSAGNLVIADANNDRVRAVAARSGTFYGQQMTAGDIYTIAGDGSFSYSGDGGPATSAGVSEPLAVTLDSHGNLLIATSGDGRIRAVAVTSGTFYGQAMTVGDIYTVAGNGHTGHAGDGGPATSADLESEGVAVDSDGNLVIADTGNVENTGNKRVRVVAVASGTFYGQKMTADDIYTVAGNGLTDSSGDRGPGVNAEVAQPTGTAVDASGNVMIADTGGNQIRVTAAASGAFYGTSMTAGDIYTIAGTGSYGYRGDGGPATAARFRQPMAAALDHAGNVVIADTRNWRIRVVAARSGTFYGQAMTADDIYTIAGNGLLGFSGDGGPATAAELRWPEGVAVDGAGNIVIADNNNNRVRVVAVTSGTFWGQAMTAGDIYTVAGNGSFGYSGDGGPATSAALNLPQGVAVDAGGNIVIGDTVNNRVRVVAGRSGTFYGQAMTAGDIYTIAGNGSSNYSGDGGPATSASLWEPEGLAVDAAGNIVIADTEHARVRVVAVTSGTFYGQAMTAGDIYTVAGNGQAGYSGDGHPATSARLFAPEDVAVGPTGSLVIADTRNNRIREVSY